MPFDVESGNGTAALCVSPRVRKLSCAMARTGTVLKRARYWARIAATNERCCDSLRPYGYEHPQSGRFCEQGKILFWGVSNFDVPDLKAAWRAGGEGWIACNQVLYNLEERAIDHAVLPWCEKHGVATVAYGPFGHGSFPDAHSPAGQVLAAIAADHGATPRQVALRFLVRHPSTFTIPKASNPNHAADNAGASLLELTEAELDRIDAAFPLGPPPRRLPTL
jgi:aryl-alcohol dehydrogenase-like predicted oxidoreductase